MISDTSMRAKESPTVAVLPVEPPAFPEHYRPVRRVGAGSFGEVWQVIHTPTGEKRAAKLLLSAEPSLRQSFFHEYALLFRLRHPGLVRTFEWSELADGTPFFTMSWVEGSVLEGAELSLPQRLRVIWELLDTLGFVHKQGLIHADLKPDNIRFQPALLDGPLDPAGKRALTLLDFGLTLDRNLRERRDRRGTVSYMAPEWFAETEIDARVDLYSLGVLIYTLFCGTPPFVADDPLVVVQKHLESVAPLLSEQAPEAPSEVVESVSRLLAKQPEIRDKGRDLLERYLASKLGARPGLGCAALTWHQATLGRYAQMVPIPLLDTWLADSGPRTILYVRGGEGLEQEHVLEALCPELARYRTSCALISDPADPRLQLDESLNRAMTALVTAGDDTADRLADYVGAWLSGTGGPSHLAVAVNVDRARQHHLALELARQARAGNAHLVSLAGLEDGTLHHILSQAAPELDLPARSALVAKAAGNPGRLFAMVHDALVVTDTSPGAPVAASRLAERLALEQTLLNDGFKSEERLAMAILATSDVAVDRSVLRALADLPWERMISRWLELGYVSTQAGSIRWRRRDLAQALEAGLPPDRRRVLHRAWAEYWGSFAPDPGSDEHQFLVAHALASNAYRRAVRVGLEAARHWIEKHQAHRGLEILEGTLSALTQVSGPPAAWVYEQAVLTAEAQRVLARYAEAKSVLEGVLSHASVRGRNRWEAEIYKRIGDLCKSLKQSAQGKSSLNEALSRYRELGDKAEVSHVLNNLGNIHYIAGELDLALSAYGEALNLQRELERPRDIASTLNNIGGLLVLRSEYDRAVSHLSESVNIKRTLHDPEELARSLNNLSVAYVETGRYAEASDVLGESYRLNVASHKTGEQLFNLENMAHVAMARGEWSLAMAYCESGLKLCHASDSRQSRLPFLLVTTGVAMAQGNYDVIDNTLREVERLRHGLEDPDIELAIRSKEVEWDLCRGRRDLALASSQRVVDLAQQEGLPSWTTRGYLQLAMAQRATAQDDESTRRYLVRCLESAEKIGALPEQIRSRIMLAEADIQEGLLEGAAEHLRRLEKLILECSSRPLFLPFSNALGAFYRRRSDLEMSLSVYETARKLATHLAMPDWTWRFLASSGHVLVDLKRFDQATGHYRGGVEVLSCLVERLSQEDRERYLEEGEKAALEVGLRTCHGAILGQKN